MREDFELEGNGREKVCVLEPEVIVDPPYGLIDLATGQAAKCVALQMVFQVIQLIRKKTNNTNILFSIH